MIALALTTATAVPAAAAPQAEPGPCHPVCRVLVLSLPAISWADLRGTRLPHLEALLARSAIADLSTRSIRQRTNAGDGYLTMGSGARVRVDPADAGQNLDPAESYGNGSAADTFARRTGRSLDRGIGALGIAGILDDNKALPYDAEPGALGTALRAARIHRAVIANADELELQPEAAQLHREAALALIDGTGRVPGGRVDASLLRVDDAAPYGVRLDSEVVVAAFRRAWDANDRSVVLVEGSDLARADAYRASSTPRQRLALRTSALEQLDRILGRLLERVDPRRDAVLVIGPYHTARARELTIAGLRAPGVAPGYLRSSTTRRDGFVQIVDVAPTVLHLLGIDRPSSMEGRPFEADGHGGSYSERVDTLVRANREALFRDGTIGQVSTTLVLLTLLLAAVALLALRRRAARAYPVLEWGALALLGFLVGTFVAGLLSFQRPGSPAYFGFLAAFALGYALVCRIAGRRGPADPIMLALGGIVTVHVLDALTGARLELGTVFGYTATVGIRLAGLGNPGSAQLCASALLLATFLAWRIRPPAGRRIARALLGVVLVVVAAPMWGQDFGGAISAAPAYLLLGLLLWGRRITARAVLALGGTLVAVGVLVGLVDLARPPDSRTHVGRFFEKVGDGSFATVLGRKIALMLHTFSSTGWVLLVVSVLAGLAYVVWRTDLLHALVDAIPTLRPGLIAFTLLAILATLLNDSGVQVMGMMLAVLVPVLVFLACRFPARAAAAVGEPLEIG